MRPLFWRYANALFLMLVALVLFQNHALAQSTPKTPPKQTGIVDRFLGIFKKKADEPKLEETHPRPGFPSLNGACEPELLPTMTLEEVTKPEINESDFHADGANVFRIGEKNSNQTLEKMTQINGIPLMELEKKLSKWHMDRAATNTRFPMLIGKGLRALLIKDNTTVLNAGLTHQEVAMPLLEIINAQYTGFFWSGEKATITFRGSVYYIQRAAMAPEGIIMRAGQKRPDQAYDLRSPFYDRLPRSPWIYKISTGYSKFLEIDGLTPLMIYRYGFYQGGNFRVSPKEIIDFFNLDQGLLLPASTH